MTADYGADEFRSEFDVSRETMDRLTTYYDLLVKWNARINLVSRTPESLWRRHFADSAQLKALIPQQTRHLVDLGAGAGFPGLVLCALLQPSDPPAVTLVESDIRKCAFLAEAARLMGLAPALRTARIETLPPLGADVVTARALAPLDGLLKIADRHRTAHGIGLFPKGRMVHKEIEIAKANWRFEYELHPSATDPEAFIVKVGALRRV